MSEYVGKIVACPREIVGSCCVKIVGDQTNCTPNSLQHRGSWQLLAIEWDYENNRGIGEAFGVKKVDVDRWIKEYATASYDLTSISGK